ncbi:monovalent cation/H+ antiporter subunit D family protein [Thalassomonas actiniarum]|uniref:Monovalent cation/H+ antiporter subunit D family protein n=1 Tax=Thalassomonas actiniarum TaxID=485447 RepID=A0AAF0C707_9GAMM|nr:monovalent cation/H+ antiporter subunit D family protein [Thalassomonas actiniarum]WDE02670.1 monovalent cation/H+ antiporter subunit D family protein [Thalassomonas actiniarum]
MIAQLPILQVIVPLLAAPCCLLVGRSKLVWFFALVASAITFVISLVLLQQVQESGTIHYSLGGWSAPFGIEYRIDLLNAYLLLIVSSITSIILLTAHASITAELNESKHKLFYVVFLLCLAGMLGIIATGDVFNLFVFLEISALSSYTLIALGQKRQALTAAFRYLLVGTLGASFILIGIGLMYMVTGTLNMFDLSERLPEVAQSRTVVTAFSFLILGVCLKLALFPLHWWLPNAYAYAPSVVSALLAATATKVAIYILLRFIFTVFGGEFSFTTLPLQEILSVLGIAGVLTASVMAIYQQNVKQLFAYSSVAQIAYMMLALAMNSTNGLIATLLHLFNHALMKGALFLALAGVMYRLGSVELTQFSGLGKRMPWTMAAIVIGGLSLIGLPLTVGFISKWYLLRAALENGWWPLAIFILLGSLLAVVYVWRIVETAYFSPPKAGHNQVKEAPLSLLLPTWILVLANLYFGCDASFTIAVTELTAQSLLGGAP